MVLALPWIVVNSDATVSMFLKLEDGKTPLAGEATVPGHEGQIQVLSFSVGGSNSGSTHIGGGAGEGTANVQDMSLVKYTDIASPELLRRVMASLLTTAGRPPPRGADLHRLIAMLHAGQPASLSGWTLRPARECPTRWLIRREQVRANS